MPSDFAVLRLITNSNFVGSITGKITGLLAFEDASSINAGLAVGIGDAGRVAHQTTGRDKLAQVIDRGNRMPGRQRDNPFPMREHERAGTAEQRTSPTLDQRCKGGLNVAVAADIENDELLPDRARRGLNLFPLCLGIRTVRIDEHGNCRRLGHELAQQLQSLRTQLGSEKAHARDVAARAVQAGNEATRDWVEPGRKDDRQRRGYGLGCEGRIVVPDDHGRLPADQIGDQSRQPMLLPPARQEWRCQW